MGTTQLPDEDIIRALKAGGSDESAALGQLYRAELPRIVRYVRRNSGTEDDARDVFQDALIVFSEQVRKGIFRQESSIKAYLRSICKHMWLNQLKRRKHADAYVDYQKDVPAIPADTPVKLMLDQEKDELIGKLMGALGDKCKEILQLRIYYRDSMQEIAERLGYKNAQNAKNRHYKCMKALRDMVKGSPQIRKMVREML